MIKKSDKEVREIEIETFLKPMGKGISRPVLVIGNDFNEYILKNEKVDVEGRIVDYNCMFVNELLSYCIGCFLEVPLPETVIAVIDGEFINEDPSIRFAYRFEKGKYFATQKLRYVENNLENNYEELMKMGKPYRRKTWKQFFDKISNKEDIVKILAFDILIANFDRYNNDGNILIDRAEQRKMYAIDHGHAFFGPFWDENKINNLNVADITPEYLQYYTKIILSQLPGSMYSALEENINLEDVSNNPFMGIIEKISSINENMLDDWLSSIPNEWYIDKDIQMVYYKNYILKQKEMVKYIIQNLADNNAFTNYKGGILEWNTQKQKCHIV